MNWVKQHRESLSVNNYVRKADAKTNYWLDFSYQKLQYYKNVFGDNFNIIVFGDEQIETDFYLIPYSELAHLLTEENFAKSEGRRRWIGNIIDHKISISHARTPLNIGHCYSIPIKTQSVDFIPSHNEENDYAIENARREVAVRINQSVFRKKVLENFQSRCCLTGIAEPLLLVASHIIPWAAKITTRLSPHNGLCLSVLYDRLFDKGYFSFNDHGEVLLTSRISTLSEPTRQYLSKIQGRKMTSPVKFQISLEHLQYHRTNIFDQFRDHESNIKQ